MDEQIEKPRRRSQQAAKPQTQSRVISEAVPSSKPLLPSVKGKLYRQKVFQTSVLALLLLSLAIYLGTRAGARTFQTEHSSDLGPTTARTSSEQRPAEAPVPTASDELQPSDPPEADVPGNLPNAFTYVVQPSDTLRDLCVSLVGRYDESVQKEVRRLNPDLKDLEHLSPGQEIRLPLNAAESGQTAP